MNMPAYSMDESGRARQRARLRRRRLVGGTPLVAPVAWSEVPLHVRPALSIASEPVRRIGQDVLVPFILVALVVTTHLALGWFASRYRAEQPTQPTKREVSIALERPPPPKLEPPRPPPPRPQRLARVVPQIEEVPPVPSETPPVESPLPPVAAAPLVSASPPPPPPLPVTPPFGRAGYLNNPAPAYPPVAARLGLEGTVLLRVRVLSSGRVESVEVQKSSGSKPLDEAAVLTVKKWLFTPSKRGDTPIDGWATVPIEFKLDQ